MSDVAVGSGFDDTWIGYQVDPFLECGSEKQILHGFRRNMGMCFLIKVGSDINVIGHTRNLQERFRGGFVHLYYLLFLHLLYLTLSLLLLIPVLHIGLFLLLSLPYITF